MATGENYNLFRELHIGHNELIFSRMIASVLKTNVGNLHGTIVKAFIGSLDLDDIEGIDFKYNEATVDTEYVIGEIDNDKEVGGRVDLILKIPVGNGNKVGFIIENKLFADDQNTQIIRYKNHAKSEYQKYYVLYLTLDGHEPSDCSVKRKNNPRLEAEEDYYCISYSNTILQWLNSCEEFTGNFSLIREAIHHFSNQIKHLTGQDMNAEEEKEIFNLLLKDGNLEIADFIFRNMDKVKTQQVMQIIDHLAQTLSPGISVRSNHKPMDKYFRINFFPKGWNNVYICSEFKHSKLNNLKIGIRYVNNNSLSESESNTIRDILNSEIKETEENRNKNFWLWQIPLDEHYSCWNSKLLSGAHYKEIEEYLEKKVKYIFNHLKEIKNL